MFFYFVSGFFALHPERGDSGRPVEVTFRRSHLFRPPDKAAQ